MTRRIGRPLPATPGSRTHRVWIGRPGRDASDSDIDLLVESLPEADVSLLKHAGLMLDLERLLGRKVDLVSKNGLKPLVRPYVLADARPVYGWDRS